MLTGRGVPCEGCRLRRYCAEQHTACADFRAWAGLASERGRRPGRGRRPTRRIYEQIFQEETEA